MIIIFDKKTRAQYPFQQVSKTTETSIRLSKNRRTFITYRRYFATSYNVKHLVFHRHKQPESIRRSNQKTPYIIKQSVPTQGLHAPRIQFEFLQTIKRKYGHTSQFYYMTENNACQQHLTTQMLDTKTSQKVPNFEQTHIRKLVQNIIPCS